jgi:metal-sulfur cluster biosynthetic enzyme
VRAVAGVTDVNVELTFDPPWGPERMSEAAKLNLGFDLAASPQPPLTRIHP